MSSYDKKVVSLFTTELKTIYIVYDIENRFAQTNINKLLLKKGFHILELNQNQPAKFRFIYETEFRLIWNQGENKELIILVNALKEQTDQLIPFDILNQCEEVDIRAKKIYPCLPDSIGKKIPSKTLNLLDPFISEREKTFRSEEFKSFLLKKIFSLDVKEWENPEILIRDLIFFLEKDSHLGFYIDIIYDLIPFNLKILLRLDILILNSRTKLFNWLSKLWSEYIIILSKKQNPIIDFSRGDLKYTIIQLIELGFVNPYEFKNQIELPAWTKNGLKLDLGFSINGAITGLKDLIKEKNKNELKIDDWNKLIDAIAHLESLISLSSETSKYLNRVLSLFDCIDEKFNNWYSKNYLRIHNKSHFFKPYTINQVLPFIYLQYKKKEIPVCLLVIDAMSAFTWKIIKNFLNIPIEWIKRESYTLVEIPTITRVSRSSLIGGIQPHEFDPLNKLPNEERLWYQFWDKKGLKKEVNFIKLHNKIDKSYEFPNSQILGLVLDDVDKIGHTSISYKDYYNRIRVFTKETLNTIINLLLFKHYKIYIIADHGVRRSNKRKFINKNPFTQSKGSRFIISEKKIGNTPELFEISGKNIGLNDIAFLYLAKGSYSLGKKEHAFDHGGLSLSETIVPFIEINKEFMEMKNKPEVIVYEKSKSNV